MFLPLLLTRRCSVPLCPQPNCITECIDTPNGKKIVVLAIRPIGKNEEVTYNYFFASEDDRIRCNCGAMNCPGRLN
jgi:histone-lysine N-methyltransferase SETD1